MYTRTKLEHARGRTYRYHAKVRDYLQPNLTAQKFDDASETNIDLYYVIYD